MNAEDLDPDDITLENTPEFWSKIGALRDNSFHLTNMFLDINFENEFSPVEVTAIANVLATTSTLTSVIISIVNDMESVADNRLKDTVARSFGNAIGSNSNLEYLRITFLDGGVPTPEFCDLFWEGCLESNSIEEISLFTTPVESLTSLTQKLVERFTSTGIKLPHLELNWSSYYDEIDPGLVILEDQTALSAVEFLKINIHSWFDHPVGEEEGTLGPVLDALANNTNLLGFGYHLDNNYHESAKVPAQLGKLLAKVLATNRHLKRFSTNRWCPEGLRLLTDGITRSETLEEVSFDELDDSEATTECIRIANVACKLRALGSKKLQDPDQVGKCNFWGKKLISIVQEMNATPSDDPPTDFTVLYRWIDDYRDLFIEATAGSGAATAGTPTIPLQSTTRTHPPMKKRRKLNEGGNE